MVKMEMIHLYELVEFLLVSDLQTSADIEKKNLRQVHDPNAGSQIKANKTIMFK